MKIAPVCRSVLDSKNKQTLDEYLGQPESCLGKLYLQMLKNGNYISSKSEATWPYSSESDADVVIIGNYSNNHKLYIKTFDYIEIIKIIHI